MNFIALIFTAFALSMDAFAVSITKGMTIKNLKKSTALKMALAFGVFQGAMPLLGWALGISFESYIKSIDHWIAFILLGFIGFNMIKGFFDDRKEENASELEFSATTDVDDLSNKEIIMLAVATSIDALAVGISFAFLNVSIIPAASIICIITFLVCVVGVFVGNKLSKEEAEELLSMYNPNVKYIYQGTENDFVALKEKGLEGYVFLMDADTDLGMFVNKDDAKIYYFHPSGYLELAE